MKKTKFLRSKRASFLVLAWLIVILFALPCHAFRITVPHPARSVTYTGDCNSLVSASHLKGQTPVPIIRKPVNGSMMTIQNPPYGVLYTYTTLVVCTIPDKKMLYIDAQYESGGKHASSPCLYRINNQKVFVDNRFGVALNATYRIRASYDNKTWGPWINFAVSTVPKAKPFPTPQMGSGSNSGHTKMINPQPEPPGRNLKAPAGR